MKPVQKILIVEDDFLLLELYETMLFGEGYEVHKASDGDEGLKQITKLRPDLVLLDLSMPSVSGFQVLEKLKQADDATPVIIISNTDEPAAIRKCRDLGAIEYIVKAQTNLEQIKDIVARTLKATAK
jgi:CheY-like chemotaxis protein